MSFPSQPEILCCSWVSCPRDCCLDWRPGPYLKDKEVNLRSRDTITLLKFQPVEDLALFSDRFSREEVRHEDAGGTGAGELPLERGEHSRHLLQAVLVLLEGGQLGQQLCLKKNIMS